MAPPGSRRSSWTTCSTLIRSLVRWFGAIVQGLASQTVLQQDIWGRSVELPAVLTLGCERPFAQCSIAQVLTRVLLCLHLRSRKQISEEEMELIMVRSNQS